MTKIVNKIYGQKLKTKQTWTTAENFDIYFFVIFGRYFYNLIFGGLTGDVSTPNFEIIVPYFPIY